MKQIAYNVTRLSAVQEFEMLSLGFVAIAK
jgi:hypothetical protein